MASLLRQIVSGPRARHPEAGLDLCYVTNNIIATSGPSGTYPQLAYRNPLKQLVKFLDEKHGEEWAIWEFRAEGTGYPDSEVYNRIYHYPWPDHHPPPFQLIPLIMGSMRNWLKGDAASKDLYAEEEVGKDLTRRKSQEQLTTKLEEIHLEQNNETKDNDEDGLQESIDKELRPVADTNAASATTEESSSSAATNQKPTPLSIDIAAASTLNGTANSSPNQSGTSTPNSTKRKKEVRWRESTLLPPKASRPVSPSSPTSAAAAPAPPSSTADTPTTSKTPTDAHSDQHAHHHHHHYPDHSKRVVVVHCKAGKGRSGTVSCSYLISEEGWTMASALQRFTERRMRPGFGAGVSIPSQLRWIGYVDRWTRHGKRYVERPVEVLEVHVWGLRDRVKVAVEGFREQGKRIEVVHAFGKEERELVRDGSEKKAPNLAGVAAEVMAQERETKRGRAKTAVESGAAGAQAVDVAEQEKIRRARTTVADLSSEEGVGDVVFRPKDRIVLETADINIDFERRNKGVSGLTMVTSVAHVWFNAFFEGDGPEKNGKPLESGVFEIEWEKMDGIKGSSRKGTKAFDRMAVLWKVVDKREDAGHEVKVPAGDEAVQDMQAADWQDGEEKDRGRDIGVERESLSSRESSRMPRDSSLERGNGTSGGGGRSNEKKVAVPA